MKLLYLLLPLLTQWAHCAGNLCLVEAIDGPISARTSYSNVDDALVISEHEAVLVASRESIDVVQIDLGEHVVATLGDVRGNVPPSLVSADDDWWVGRMITDGDGTNVVFATAADTRLHEQRIETGGKPLYWVPVDGQEPSSIIVSVAAQQPALRFAHVTPSGIQQLGSAEWWQTSSRLLISHDSRWSAEALAGGRFVLAALDNPDDAYPLKVWRLDGSSKEFTVPCRMADRPIGTATDGNGMLVAVGISPEDGVVTATFDQEEPDKARCEVLSTPGERVARMDFGVPQVIWTGTHFVAAWIRDDGAVRARELRPGGVASAVTVGTDADTRMPLRHLVRLRGDELSFTWRSSDGRILTRDEPAELAAAALQREFLALVCSWAEKFRTSS